MIRTFGKIKYITSDHPILNPTIDKPMDFYNGNYFIKDKFIITQDNTNTELEGGYLTVYVNYSSMYEEGNNTSFYINYKLSTIKGVIYTWKYYVHKEEETIVLVDKMTRPKMVLTKNTLGKLSYTKAEMEELFLNRKRNHLDDHRYFIKTPVMESVEIDWDKLVDTDPSFIRKSREGNTTLYDESNVTSEEIIYDPKMYLDSISNKVTFIDWNLHPNNEGEQWVDLFNLGNNLNWDKLYLDNMKLSTANGVFYPSHMFTYGVHGLMNTGHSKLGEFILQQPNKMSKIEHNTYLTQYHYYIKDNTGFQRPALYRSEATDNYYTIFGGNTHTHLYMSRLLYVPDDKMMTSPIVHYSSNLNVNHINAHHKVEDASLRKNDIMPHEMGKRTLLHNAGDIEWIPDDQDNIYMGTNLPKYARSLPNQFFPGIFTSVVFKKHSPNVLYEMFMQDIPSTDYNKSYNGKITKYTNGEADLATLMTYRGFDGEGITNYHIFSNIDPLEYYNKHIYQYFYDIDPAKALYRSNSHYFNNTSHIDKVKDIIVNTENSVTDIRLGSEERYTVDKSEIYNNFDSRSTSDKIFQIKGRTRAHALTYFKPEINKSRYNSSYNNLRQPLHPEMVDFSSKFTNFLNLPMNQKLTIDKVTVGFRPIQVKIKGVWKNIE